MIVVLEVSEPAPVRYEPAGDKRVIATSASGTKPR